MAISRNPQANCLRLGEGTSDAGGIGSLDGPKGRERVCALVRERQGRCAKLMTAGTALTKRAGHVTADPTDR